MVIDVVQNQSFWEQEIWPVDTDALIVGAGIVGMHAALTLKSARPNWKIIVVDAGWNQQGASTKNAGFVCLGSPSELLDDIRSRGHEECMRTLEMRFRGTEYLRKQAAQTDIDFLNESGYEVFTREENHAFEDCCDHLGELNRMFHEVTGLREQFRVVNKASSWWSQSGMIECVYEGSIHPGKWVWSLHAQAIKVGIHVLRGTRHLSHEWQGDNWNCSLSAGNVRARRMIFATNGYSGEEHFREDLVRAKNQVYLTNAYNIPLSGTYHASQGFIYFRKVEGRLLIGGARHKDANAHSAEYNHEIEDYLMDFVRRNLPSGESLRFERRWIGFLGVGQSKYPIIKPLGDRMYAAVRLGGMGVAIGAEVGRKVAEMCLEDE